MHKIAALTIISASLFTGSMAFAQELSGLWQQIDDKTGSPKALIEMKTEADGSYTGTITKVTPRQGYTPREKCIKTGSAFLWRTSVFARALRRKKSAANRKICGRAVQ